MGAAVVDALAVSGLSSHDIGFFTMDGGSTVCGAIPLLPDARHIVCLAHTLNKCAKAMFHAPGFKAAMEFYEIALTFAHAVVMWKVAFDLGGSKRVTNGCQK